MSKCNLFVGQWRSKWVPCLLWWTVVTHWEAVPLWYEFPSLELETLQVMLFLTSTEITIPSPGPSLTHGEWENYLRQLFWRCHERAPDCRTVHRPLVYPSNGPLKTFLNWFWVVLCSVHFDLWFRFWASTVSSKVKLCIPIYSYGESRRPQTPPFGRSRWNMPAQGQR